ncbi:MAG: hypothetical protein KDC95_23500, partial [Planctomycetes bacterium]|nr:hypothetical protein [Planctomycetota bacterium]
PLLRPDIRPRRAPIQPKVARMPPLAGAVEFADSARRQRPPRAKAKNREPEAATPRRTALALGLAAGSAVVTAAGLVVLHRMTKT